MVVSLPASMEIIRGIVDAACMELEQRETGQEGLLRGESASDASKRIYLSILEVIHVYEDTRPAYVSAVGSKAD